MLASTSSTPMLRLGGHTEIKTALNLGVIFPPWVIHDRVHQFMLRSGTLFWRELTHLQAEHRIRVWNVVKLPNGIIPIQVKVDWENLMVLDNKGFVHYAKSYEEERSCMRSLLWHSGIWDLPLISSDLFNQLFNKKPKFEGPTGGQWGCSFLEAGCFYVDAALLRHELGNEKGEIGPTTTAFIADQQHRIFRFYDSHLGKVPEDKEALFIPFPETSTQYFELLGMASCRSGIFAIGYDIRRSNEAGVEKDLALYYIGADANLLGLNPLISYTYSKKPEQVTDFVLPAVVYHKIDLPKESKLTPIVGIERRMAAKGMMSVVLTIKGVKELETKGKKIRMNGFFYQVLGESEWKFKEKKNHKINKEQLLKESLCMGNEKFQPLKVFDYVGQTGTGEKAEMLHFGTNSMDAAIFVEVNGKKHEMHLYSKFNQRDLWGAEKLDYTLVMSEEVCRAVGFGKEVNSVSVEYSEGLIALINGADGIKFEFFQLNFT